MMLFTQCNAVNFKLILKNCAHMFTIFPLTVFNGCQTPISQSTELANWMCLGKRHWETGIDMFSPIPWKMKPLFVCPDDGTAVEENKHQMNSTSFKKLVIFTYFIGFQAVNGRFKNTFHSHKAPCYLESVLTYRPCQTETFKAGILREILCAVFNNSTCSYILLLKGPIFPSFWSFDCVFWLFDNGCSCL